jgi:hypothetical protein
MSENRHFVTISATYGVTGMAYLSGHAMNGRRIAKKEALG